MRLLIHNLYTKVRHELPDGLLIISMLMEENLIPVTGIRGETEWIHGAWSESCFVVSAVDPKTGERSIWKLLGSGTLLRIRP